MKFVIGLTGQPLAGKETAGNAVAALLERDGYTVARYRFSDILRDTLDLWGMPHGRDNEQKLAQLMQRMEEGTLSRAMGFRLKKSSADVGIIDGVRWLTDEEMIRGLVKHRGMKSMIIYITADAGIRYDRMRRRNRSGEAGVTRERFDEQNRAENETYIPTIGARADVMIENNYDTPEEFEREVAKIYQSTIRPLFM